jgi:hypothetical protein
MKLCNRVGCISGAALFSLLGFFWLLFLLAQDGESSRKEAFFRVEAFPADLHERVRLEAGRTVIALVPQETAAGEWSQSVELSTSIGDDLAKVERLILEIEVAQPVVVASARLVFDSEDVSLEPAIYESRPNRKLEGAASLGLLKVSAVPRDIGAKARLEIRTTEPEPLSLRVQKTADGPVSPFFWMEVRNADGAVEYANVQGWFRQADSGPAHSRAELLAYTWGWGTAGALRIYAIWAVSIALWCGGLFLLLKGQVPRGAGWALLSAAVVFLYSVLTPPFQSPDEPDHLLTFAAISEDEALPADILALANTGHFERIKFRTEEFFSSQDVERPLEAVWASHVYATEVDRSPFARIIWGLVAKVVPDGNASATMFALRGANGLFLILCLAGALATTRLVADDTGGLWWLAAPTLLLPAVAFFSTAVSNYAYLVGGYLLQGAGLALLWSCFGGDARRGASMAVAAGALAGIGAAVAVCAADNGIISLIFWTSLVPFLAWASAHESAATFRFLGALSGGFAIVCGLVSLADPSGLSIAPRIMAELQAHFPSADFGPRGTAALLAALWLTVMFVAAWVASGLGRWLGKHIAWPHWRRAMAVVYTLLCLAVLVAGFRPLQDIEPVGALSPKAEYVADVLLRFVDGLLPGVPDWFTTSSFWGWFGWLDTPLPLPLRLGLQWGTGAGLLLLAFVSLRGDRAAGRSIFLAGCACSVLLSVAVIAAMYHTAAVNVHGRYLIGVYVFVFVLAVEGWRRMAFSQPDPFSSAMAATSALCLGAVVVHATALSTILQRYF